MSRVSMLLMMTALTVAGCSSKVNPVNWFGEDKLQSVANQLTQALVGEQVVVDKHGNQIKLTSSADYLYPSGGWRLPPDGSPALTKMVPTFSKLQHTNIAVNGYTDNQPVGASLQSKGIMNNADLSMKRAETVVTYFLNHGVNRNLLSANGYGSNDPVASNDTPEGRARNRRVEITLTGDGT